MGTAGQAALAVGWLLVVIFLPDGLGGVLVRGRDWLYDAIARRHGLDPLRVRHGVVDDDARVAAAPGATPRGALRAPARTGRRRTDRRSILTVTGLSRRFGGVVAVDQVDFEVAPGEILGVIGPNGAGKTTCFEIVAGFTKPDTGTVVFDGIDVTGATPGAARPRGPGPVVPGRRALPDADRARDADGRPGAARADPPVGVRARRTHR